MPIKFYIFGNLLPHPNPCPKEKGLKERQIFSLEMIQAMLFYIFD